MTLNKTLLAGFSAFALSFGASVGVASAQESAPLPEVQAPASAAPQVDEEKLKSFAVAFLEVSKVTQEYQPQISAATPEEQQRLQQEVGAKMMDAVEESNGITVEEYNTIIQSAQADPELAQRINSHIAAAAGESGATGAPAQ